MRTRLLKLSAGRPVAILHKDVAARLNMYVDDRILIKRNKKIIAVVDIAAGMIGKDEMAVSTEVSEFLNLKQGSRVEVSLAPEPRSNSFIYKKLNGKSLNELEIREIINDIVNNALTESEIAYFVSAVYKCGMSMKEIMHMTKAIVDTGKSLRIDGNIVDKHGIGGIPNNRTTPIVVSICAAAGLTVPKTSSRAITSAAGTADVVETLCKVEFSVSELKKIIKKTNACMVWGGALGLAPADDKIIQVERLLNLDPEAQLLASIMAKKLAVGSKYVLIDIPFGKTAKVNRSGAISLQKKFEKLAKCFGIKLKCALTDGSQPIGNGVGPVLEMRDVISVLSRQKSRPLDLERKALNLSALLLRVTRRAKKGNENRLAKEILNSSLAFEKFKEIILAQGGKVEMKDLKYGKYHYDIRARRKCRIKEINNKAISNLARIAGCPADKAAGLYLWKHVGELVDKGEKVMTIYSDSKDRLKGALNFYKSIDIIKT